jgi:hypothetical protein
LRVSRFFFVRLWIGFNGSSTGSGGDGLFRLSRISKMGAPEGGLGWHGALGRFAYILAVSQGKHKTYEIR